jgi:hypothetical protein
VRWTLGDRLLASAEVRGIAQAALQQSLYLVVASNDQDTADKKAGTPLG